MEVGKLQVSRVGERRRLSSVTPRELSGREVEFEVRRSRVGGSQRLRRTVEDATGGSGFSRTGGSSRASTVTDGSVAEKQLVTNLFHSALLHDKNMVLETVESESEDEDVHTHSEMEMSAELLNHPGAKCAPKVVEESLLEPVLSDECVGSRQESKLGEVVGRDCLINLLSTPERSSPKLPTPYVRASTDPNLIHSEGEDGLSPDLIFNDTSGVLSPESGMDCLNSGMDGGDEKISDRSEKAPGARRKPLLVVKELIGAIKTRVSKSPSAPLNSPV